MPHNIPRKLSTAMIYPAILGVFLYETINPLTRYNSLVEIGHLWNEDPLVITCKLLLIISTLTFYCCDFVNSETTETYTWKGFFTDMITVLIIVISFHNLKIEEIIKHYTFRPWLYFTCFAVFMFVYMLRYWREENKMNADQKKHYKMLFIWERRFFSLFLLIGILDRLIPGNNWVLLSGTVLAIIAAIIYCLMILEKLKCDKELIKKYW